MENYFLYDSVIYDVDIDSDEERRPYTIRNKINHLEFWDEADFFARFRLKKSTFMSLLSKVEDQLLVNWNKSRALTPVNQLLLTLRFYATGSFLRVSGDFSGVSISSASIIIKKVSKIIASLYKEFIFMPRNSREIVEVQEGFYSMYRFPRVVGCIDCTHVKIQSPGGEFSELFRNRKGFFSLNVQAVCDSNMKALNVVARWPGSSHDSTVFSHSILSDEFERKKYGNSVLLGDSGYPLKSYILTPVLNPLVPGEIRYNDAHIKTRNTIERFFSVWKRRFPVLSVGMRLKVENIQNVIIATAVLFNFAKAHNEEEPAELEIRGEYEDIVSEITNNDLTTSGDNLTRRMLIENYFSNLS